MRIIEVRGGMKMALLGATAVGFAVIFFLVAFVQFTREVMRSRKTPKHLIRMRAGRPAAKIFTLREPPALSKTILAGRKGNGVATAPPVNAAIKRWPAKGSS
jgi:hypothetical protein